MPIICASNLSSVAFIFQDDANCIQGNVTNNTVYRCVMINCRCIHRSVSRIRKHILSQVEGVKTRAIKKPLDTGLRPFFFFFPLLSAG